MERILWRSFESCKDIDSWHTGSDTAEVATAIKGIKSGKAASEDEIRPEMLKVLAREEILWVVQVCQVAWKFGKTPRDWQIGVIIPILRDCKLADRKFGWESICQMRWKEMPKNSGIKTWGCFRSGRNTTDQIFNLKQIFEKSLEYGKDLVACFVDLEKRMTEFLGINFGRFYGSMALMVSCYASLSHSTTDWRFVFA